MTTPPPPIQRLVNDIVATPPADLASRVSDTRAAAVATIQAMPGGPVRKALEEWLAGVDDDAQAVLRRPAAAYGRLWIAAQTASLSGTPAPPPVQAPAPAPEVPPELYIGDPRPGARDAPGPRSATRLPSAPIRRPPMVKTAPAPPAFVEPAPRRLPQGRPGPSQHRPLGPAADDDDIPF